MYATATFASLAEDHLDGVFAYLAYLTGSRSMAEDLTSETFERALRLWRRFDPRRGSAKTWLFQVARSTALDHFRAERRRRQRETAYSLREAREEAHEAAFGEGLSPELEEALAALSAADRELIALRIVLELDTTTTARLLGISQTACTTRLSRVLQKLQERMGTDVAA